MRRADQPFPDNNQSTWRENHSAKFACSRLAVIRGASSSAGVLAQ